MAARASATAAALALAVNAIEEGESLAAQARAVFDAMLDHDQTGRFPTSLLFCVGIAALASHHSASEEVSERIRKEFAVVMNSTSDKS